MELEELDEFDELEEELDEDDSDLLEELSLDFVLSELELLDDLLAPEEDFESERESLR